MRVSTIGYSIKQGGKNIWRNKLFSVASIATMGACIFHYCKLSLHCKKCGGRRIHDRYV